MSWAMDRDSCESQEPVKGSSLQVKTERAINTYSAFNPREYIREYYAALGPENKFLLDFYHEAYSNISSGASLLEFGGGPTVYQLLSAGLKVKEIVFAEHLAKNRSEVAKWVYGELDAVNWDEFLHYVLSLDKKPRSPENLQSALQSIKPKITEIIECDAHLPDILAGFKRYEFDVVSSSFCLECISPIEQTFIEFIKKLSRRLNRKGTLMLTMLKNAASYQVGGMHFAAFPVDEKYMKTLLTELGFSEITIQSIAAEHEQGYEGLMAMTAKRGAV